MPTITFRGRAYQCHETETVLDALTRHNVEVPYSCKKGICFSCMMRNVDGPVPIEAQDGIRDTLCAQGYFLACICKCDHDRELAPPEDAMLFSRASVIDIHPLAANISRIRLEPATPLYYHAGQFINLRRGDGLTRSYSLASVPRLDEHLELHVKRMNNGAMSNWLLDDLKPGDTVDIQGPNGAAFYVPGRADQNMVLIGNGTGLAPLIGIIRDALQDGHQGEIHLYHASRHPGGLYLADELEQISEGYGSFTYMPCLSGPEVPPGSLPGRADDIALADLPDLTDWRVFLSGCAPMVHSAKKRAYLAGAALADIYGDPFELRDLRTMEREAMPNERREAS